MRTSSDIQAEIETVELKKIRPLSSLQLNSDDTVAASRLIEIEHSLVALRAELRDAEAAESAALAAQQTGASTEIASLSGVSTEIQPLQPSA